MAKMTKVKVLAKTVTKINDLGGEEEEPFIEFDFVVAGGFGIAYNRTRMLIPDLDGENVHRDGWQGGWIFKWTLQNSGQNSQNSGQKMEFSIKFIPFYSSGWAPIEGKKQIDVADGDPNLSDNVVLVENGDGSVLCFENDAGYWNVVLPDDVRLCRKVK